MQLIKIMFRFCFSTFLNIFFLWLRRSIAQIYMICLFIGSFYLFATNLDAVHLLHSTQIRHYSKSKLQRIFQNTWVATWVCFRCIFRKHHKYFTWWKRTLALVGIMLVKIVRFSMTVWNTIYRLFTTRIAISSNVPLYGDCNSSC